MLARLGQLGSNRNRSALVRALVGGLRQRSQAGMPSSAAARAIDPTGADAARHLDATYRWLCAAQDATPDGGVSGLYDIWTGRWSASYPETTGYIIPSFLALADARDDDEARGRALRMADWLCVVQMDDGAVLSGLLGAPRGPAVFNTGQAVFGWVAAHERTGEDRYATAASRACEWLLACQDADGAWRRNLSLMTSAPVHTYNGRCAWALIYAAQALGEPRFAESAHAASEWVLGQQNDVGWFSGNAFTVDEVPLLHTISYVIEGLLGVWALSGESRYLEAARRAVDAIVELSAAGCLAGRLDSTWRPTVGWRCPTGEAQIAAVLLRLERAAPGGGYHEPARRLIRDQIVVQRGLN
ncbi:MAG: hypothetical protein ACRDL5_16705, partial [Solirubrobacteraceae bacterium]